MSRISHAIIWAMVLAGCATQQSGTDPLAQCQAGRAACDKERQMCLESMDRVSKSLDQRTREHSEVVKEQAATKDALSDCQARAEQTSTRAQTLSAAKADLEKRLSESIKQKDVQISLLNDRLSVRVLDRILFDSGSATIRGEGLTVLGQVAQVLANGSEYIRVEGHTDNVPISALLQARYPTNWELSGARATSVVRLFQEMYQIDPTRMEAVGHSFYQPVADNDTPENRHRNRRVEVVLTAAK